MEAIQEREVKEPIPLAGSWPSVCLVIRQRSSSVIGFGMFGEFKVGPGHDPNCNRDRDERGVVDTSNFVRSAALGRLFDNDVFVGRREVEEESEDESVGTIRWN